jgi:biopolymer transport protein ExbB/TolQ
MTAQIILIARACGTVLAWPIVFLVALFVEILRQTYQTIRGTWRGTAGLSEATREPRDAERERDIRSQAKKLARAEVARRRREARTRGEKRGWLERWIPDGLIDALVASPSPAAMPIVEKEPEAEPVPKPERPRMRVVGAIEEME